MSFARAPQPSTVSPPVEELIVTYTQPWPEVGVLVPIEMISTTASAARAAAATARKPARAW